MIWNGTSPLRPEHEVSDVSTALDRVMDWFGSPNILWQHRWDDDGGNAVCASIMEQYWAMPKSTWFDLVSIRTLQKEPSNE